MNFQPVFVLGAPTYSEIVKVEEESWKIIEKPFKFEHFLLLEPPGALKPVVAYFLLSK